MSTQEIDRQAIMSRALRHGFTLRQQPGGEMDLNEYVYAFAREIFEAGQKAGRAKLDGVTYSMTTSVGMPKWIGLQGQGFRAIGFVFQDAKGRTGSLTEHGRVTWDQGLAHPAEDDGSLTLSKSDVEFLAARIRRLIKTFDYHEPEKDDRFIVEVAGSLIGGVLRQIEAHPCQGHARQQEAEESAAMTYSYSYDDETFCGTFASPEEAAADYLNDRPDEESVEVGQNQRRTSHNYVGEYHIESLLEMVAESAYEECGDYAESWLSDLTKDTKQIKELKQIVGDWIQRKEPPGFWHVDFIRRITRAELVESGHLDQPSEAGG